MATAKSMKIQAEIDKVKAKISEQQARLKELEQKKLEAENSEIVDIVRGMSISAKRLLRRLWRSWSMPLLPHCGPSWSRANGWAAILCRMPARIVYRSRLPQSS